LPEVVGTHEHLQQTATLIRQSKYVVVMTGAGMSVESGIPTFRGEGGLWTRYGPPRMDGFKQFHDDPVGWWQRRINQQMDAHIIELRDALVAAEPHAGHHALAGLEKAGAVHHVITQNIDGLDLKAGLKNLTEIHGNRSRLRCIGCGTRISLGDFVPIEPPEPCTACGGPIKFDTVMFGEPIPADTMSEARRQIEMATCVVAVGTSASVRPASGLLWIAKANGATVIEINPNETKLTPISDVTVRLSAGTALAGLLNMLTADCESSPGSEVSFSGCTICIVSESGEIPPAGKARNDCPRS
jgi:NAD-dependent deacetylase